MNQRKTDNTMVKRKRTKGLIIIYKTLQRKLKIEQHEHHWNRVWTQVLRKGKRFLLHKRLTWCYSCYTNDKSKWGKDRNVITTNETYPWTFVTQILRNGVTVIPSHSGDRKLSKWWLLLSFLVYSCNRLSKEIMIGTTSFGISDELRDI